MRVFITGVCGTLGTTLAELHHSRGDSVWGCARNEANAVRWLERHGKTATLFLCDAKHLSGDPSDLRDISLHLRSMDVLYHCAAAKHVNLCEQQPVEAMEQNVRLTETVSLACKRAGVRCVVISSDKACLPQGVYGATKLLAERVALRHGAAVVRLGNLIGSSGSVFEAWARSVQGGGRIRLTDPECTRYFLTVAEAAHFVVDHSLSGAVTIPAPIRAARMGDVASALTDRIDVTGLRPGETLHQWLIAPGDRVTMAAAGVVLDAQGDVWPEGMSSDRAKRWDTGMLLTAAGVTSRK